MEKRYSETKHSKKPIVIVLALIAVVAAAAAAAVFIFGGQGGENQTVQTTAPSLTATEATQAAQSSATEQTTETASATQSGEATTAQTSDDENTQTLATERVAVATSGGDAGEYFNATFVPYKAVDTYTNSECSLKEVFGSSYLSGAVTFNSDGTFTDTLILSNANTGAYEVESNSIVATYSDDKNMDISVSSWDGSTPSELVINYAGYDVYLSM